LQKFARHAFGYLLGFFNDNTYQTMELSRTIERPDGGIVGYRIKRGDGPRPLLVMIHGLASNLTRWSEFVEYTRLDQQWDLLRIDLRGHGSSMYRGHIGMEMWADDLAAVLEAECYEQATILGHSLGAQVGMHFHSRYPDRVSGLIMIDPVFPNNLGGRLLKAKQLKWLVWLTIRLLWLANRFGLGRKHFPPRDLRKLDEQTREILNANPDIEIGQLYTNPFVDLEFIPVVNYLQDTYEVTRALPPLEDISPPVLVLLSAGASVSDPKVNEEMINRMPNVETVTIEANHWLLTERPKEAREAIEQWCDQHVPQISGNTGN
jgi:esterase